MSRIPSGAVIALVAKSGTGKTTASSQLARTFGYITDETVAIRADGTVVPYPKPLSVKQATPGAAKLQVGPDELGLQVAPDNPRITAIALLDRVAGGDYQLPVIEPVPLVDAVLALIPDTSSQAAVVQPLQSLCRLIDSVGGVFRVSYSEAADLKDSLAPLFLTEPDQTGGSHQGMVARPGGAGSGAGIRRRKSRTNPRRLAADGPKPLTQWRSARTCWS